MKYLKWNVDIWGYGRLNYNDDTNTGGNMGHIKTQISPMPNEYNSDFIA